ncbi:MAG: FtsX-like permease family protein [Acidobacteriia bacterium]|nr:FtsX-like permease family protein [Terriglobia bacterium]
MARAGQPDAAGRREVSVGAVSSEYFQTVKLPVLRGRVFTRTAVSNEIVISQALSRALWASADPIGQELLDDAGRAFSVIGVVRDVDLLSAPAPTMYRSMADGEPGGVLLASVEGSVTAVGQQMRQALLQIDPSSAVQPRTLASAFEELATRFSVLVTFVSFLGGVGIVLAIIGVYGVVAFAVSRRTKEVGIRMALGATKPVIVRLLLSSGVAPVIVGLVSGVLVALGAASVLGKVLTGMPVPIDVRDPAAFGLVTVVLIATVAGAMGLPAWRATEHNPVDALRQD